MPVAVVQGFYEKDSGTACYVVNCPKTKRGAIIDSVLDYDAASGSISTKFADNVFAYVAEKCLQIDWILESHAHADHLTAAQYLKSKLGGTPKTAIGKLITGVQTTFLKVFAYECKLDGSQWDHLFQANEEFKIGDMHVVAYHVPGHTPDHMAYYIENDCIFTGDSLFMADSGTARCDFPNGSAEDLWNSIQQILSLPPTVRVFVGHDYAPGGRSPAWETTVADQKKNNIHVKEGTEKAQFIDLRKNRDGTLGHPRLIIPALQVNLQAGLFPKPEKNGNTYLKIPINVMKPGADIFNAK